MPEHSIRDLFIRYLRQNNIIYSSSPEGIRFSKYGVVMFLWVYPDPNYIRMTIDVPVVRGDEHIGSRINSINRDVRAVKVFQLTDTTLGVSVEQYAFSESGIFLLFNQMIELLLHIRLSPEFKFNH